MYHLSIHSTPFDAWLASIPSRSTGYFRNIMIFINNIKFNKIKKIFLRAVMRATLCTESNMLSSYSRVVIFNYLPEYKFMKKKFCRHTDFMPTTSITRCILACLYLTFYVKKFFSALYVFVDYMMHRGDHLLGLYCLHSLYISTALLVITIYFITRDDHFLDLSCIDSIYLAKVFYSTIQYASIEIY